MQNEIPDYTLKGYVVFPSIISYHPFMTPVATYAFMKNTPPDSYLHIGQLCISIQCIGVLCNTALLQFQKDDGIIKYLKHK